MSLRNRLPSPFQWDGKSIAIKQQRIGNILHDIAHWQVCTPARRKLPDFGLGEGPESRGYRNGRDPLVPVTKYAQSEEELASLLGIAWLFHLGFIEEGIWDLHEHNWSPTHPNEPCLTGTFMRVVTDLKEMGFLNADGITPTYRSKRRWTRKPPSKQQGQRHVRSSRSSTGTPATSASRT